MRCCEGSSTVNARGCVERSERKVTDFCDVRAVLATRKQAIATSEAGREKEGASVTSMGVASLTYMNTHSPLKRRP